MKKSFLKTCSVLMLAGIMPLSAACGKKGGDGQGGASNSATALDIFVLDAGYGTDWCEGIKELFLAEDWVKEKYGDITVTINSNDQKSYATSMMAAGKKNNYDLLFGQQMGGYYGTTQVVNLETSVYDAEVPGESIKYKDKINASILAEYQYKDIKGNGMDGFYGVPWQGGQLGITYNQDVLTAAGVTEVPRTSNELEAACAKVKAANLTANGQPVYGIIQSSEAPYWDMYFFPTWWAQYDGIDGYNNFYQGLYEDNDGELVQSSKVFEELGRLRALQAFESIMDSSKEYVSPQSFNDKFMIAQTAYIKGAAAFHVNGVYFTNEMISAYQEIPEADRDTIMLMRSPVLSSVIELVNDIENDAELSALVKAIDEESTALSGEGYSVSQTTYNKIREARFTVNGASGNTMGVIPSHSPAKELAIDFVRYMATDKALAKYAEKTYGTLLDFHFDLKSYDKALYDSFQPLNRGVIDYYSASYPVQVLRSKNSFPMYSVANVTPFVDTNYWSKLTATGTGKKTAQQYHDETVAKWSEPGVFDTALTQAGLK